MAKVSISEAARLAGISRQHLYKRYINSGALSVEKDGENPPVIDTSELIRVFGELKAEGQPVILSDNDCALPTEIKTLRRELADRDVQLQEAREREAWLRQHISEMTGALRLLENKDKTGELQTQLNKARDLVRQYRKALEEERDALDAERSKSFFSRLFNGGT